MKHAKRLSVVGVVLLLGVGAAVYTFRAELGLFLYTRAVDRAVSAPATASLPDGLHVFLCGTGSPMPDSRRAGPCVGILAGQRAFVIDAGSGGPRKLARMGFPVGALEGVLLTHLHSDHIDSLGELIMLDWVGGDGRSIPLQVTGPRGTREVVAGFNMAYRIDSGYRIAHHGEAVASPAGVGGGAREIAIPAGSDTYTLQDDSDLRITAIRVDHAPAAPAFGYRFDYRGRAVALSGDTVFQRAFVDASSGVDL
ncbi:MAG: MBL fold metallo-hydrolase, partial [Chromatocurvus sp.]